MIEASVPPTIRSRRWVPHVPGFGKSSIVKEKNSLKTVAIGQSYKNIKAKNYFS